MCGGYKGFGVWVELVDIECQYVGKVDLDYVWYYQLCCCGVDVGEYDGCGN